MRGNKIWSIALLLSLALSMFAIVVKPGFAQGTSIIAPSIVNALQLPGTSFTIDILVKNVVDMWNFDFILNYDPTVLHGTFILPNPTDPVAAHGFEVTTAAEIDNTLGTMHVGANRGPSGNIVGEFIGTGDGVNKIFFLQNIRVLSAATTKVYVNGVSKPFALTTSSGKVTMTTAPPAGATVTADYNHPGLTSDAEFPICSITFDVVARGYSPLDLQSVSVQDVYFNPITMEVRSGEFDNRFQGHVAAPIYKNLALKSGDEFDLPITASQLRYNTWGIQFFLDYDPAVLTAMYATVGEVGEIVKWADQYNITDPAIPPGSIYVEFEHILPAETGAGLLTEDPLSIATIHFKLLAAGWTVLHIRDIAAVDSDGYARYFDSTDGSFASVNPIDLTRRGAWPDTMLPMYGTIDTLHAQVTTTGTGTPVTFQVVFTIYDLKGGFPLGTIMTAPATMPPPTTMEVTAPFDTTAWGTLKYYWFIGFYMVKVKAQVTYDSNGDGIMDTLGNRVKQFYILVYAFKW